MQRVLNARKFAYGALLIFGFAGALFLAVKIFDPPPEFAAGGDLSCVSKLEKRTVRGDSLAGMVEDGQVVEIAFGYYDCNRVAREDIVVYFYGGSDDPVIKIVKALPGDSFELVPAGDVYHIAVNGETLTNSLGERYAVTLDRYRRFQLYEEDYGAGLPDGTYMILSNVAADSADSRAFGLVDKSDILGKAVISGP